MLSAGNGTTRALGLRSAPRRSTARARSERLTGGISIVERATWLFPLYLLTITVFVLPIVLPPSFLSEGLFGLTGMAGLSHGTFWSVVVNVGAYVVISIVRRSSTKTSHAAQFVEAPRSLPGTVSVGELTDVLARLRGRADAEHILGAYAREWNLDTRSSAAASSMLIRHAEILLAGVMGTVSARIVLGATVSEDQTRVDDVIEMIDEVSQVAILEERQRLARELHDSVAQALFSMTLHMRTLELAAHQEGRELDGPFGRSLTEMRDLTQGALEEMRAALFQLRPGGLHEVGLAEAIRKQAMTIAARTGLPIRVHAPEERLWLDESIEAELFRVVQEATHNCVKHASPRSIEIRLVDSPGSELVVEIVDDGIGFDPSVSRPGAIGLASMRERMRRIGGLLIIDSGNAGFTTVRATLPRTPGGATRLTTAGRNSRERIDG